LFEKSFEVGDLIELNDKIIGFVSQIGGRYISIKTFCGKEMMVPNEEFVNYKIINWTHRDSNLRLEIKIEVSYQEDINEVKHIILSTAEKRGVLNQPYASS
jgi:small-conductance mechanosensitive channel